MDYRLYEKYVAEVIKNLNIFKHAKVYRNRKYSGIHQPGSYEIDISFELFIDNALYFLIIVECKNWKNPVARPQVQKLIQTRDAICAHKADFASPVGYTKEAIEVAKANGIALWVIAESKFSVLEGGGAAALMIAMKMADNLRKQICNLLGYSGGFRPTYSLVPFSWTSNDIEVLHYPSCDYFLGEWAFKHESAEPSELSINPILGVVINHILDNIQMKNSVTQKVYNLYHKYQSILVQSGAESYLAQEFLDEFVKKSIIKGCSILLNKIEVFDGKLNHVAKRLFAPKEWLEQNGKKFFIYTSPNVVDFVKLENNIIWANVIWLLHKNGLID